MSLDDRDWYRNAINEKHRPPEVGRSSWTLSKVLSDAGKTRDRSLASWSLLILAVFLFATFAIFRGVWRFLH